jgi:hypothetical protein
LVHTKLTTNFPYNISIQESLLTQGKNTQTQIQEFGSFLIILQETENKSYRIYQAFPTVCSFFLISDTDVTSLPQIYKCLNKTLFKTGNKVVTDILTTSL